jgi:alpha-1,6-mannosyltransferase
VIGLTRLRFAIVATGEAVHPRGANHPGGQTRSDAPAMDGTIAEVAQAAPLDGQERRQLSVIRRFGTTGALLLGVGAIGAGAAPVDNPLAGVRLIGLPARIPTVAMACTWLGVLMVVVSWLWLGKLSWPGRARMLSRTQLERTVMMWALPLAIAPPLFTRDMYAYLAQSEIARRGLDPYMLSPAAALGVNHPFTMNVPNVWRGTPAPYGPLFLLFGRGIASVIGENVVFGVLLWRVVMLAGLALAIWAIPHLARRCGVQPVCALWLCAANPIVLFHEVSGMHNDALMVGMMLAGIELGLRSRSPWAVAGAAVLITAAGAIKPPGFVALGFLGIYLARRRGGKLSDLAAVTVVLTVIFVMTMTVITLASGWGLGWIHTFDVPDLVKTPLAPMTLLGMIGGGIGMLLGLGNHTDAMLSITKVVGYGVAATICVRLLWISFKGRLEPLAALGVTLGGLALFSPVLYPWYLLWAVMPLAPSTNDSRFRIFAIGVSSFVALVVPPSGGGYEDVFQIPFAVTAAAIAFLIAWWLVRKKVPQLWPPRTGVSPVTP